jgi:ribosomal protein S18 acetylase RimI-like enzyme
MHNVESCALSLHELNPVVSPHMVQDELLANVLGRAFQGEPNSIYVFPDESARLEMLPSFFLEAIRIARLYGEIDTTPKIDGAALWICPGREFAIAQIVRAGTLAMSFKLRNSFKRCLKLINSVEGVHHRLLREPHWYLMALAVAPTEQECSIESALLDPGLSRADSDGLPCYLETFREGNLRFYEENGFRIAGAGCIPGGPSFWAMIRKPRRGTVGESW